jgi:vacuolar protein sorting-associated protein 54
MSPRIPGSLSGHRFQAIAYSFSYRPSAQPSELTAIHDSLFDTLSSTIESANVLVSKVLSARSEQHAKLDLREFVEMFNECWSFVVRCEVTCKRMIVGLRGVAISQVSLVASLLNGRRLTRLIGQVIPADVPPISD